VPPEYGVRDHRYTVVNGRTVLVEPRTRRIVIIQRAVFRDDPFVATTINIGVPMNYPA
jgi:hypothetical protein